MVKTYPEMDAKIVGILRISTKEVDLYAAQRIEDLEDKVAEQIIATDRLKAKLQRAEAALRTMSVCGHDPCCGPELANSYFSEDSNA